MCVRNRPNVDRSPRATPVLPPPSYLGRQASLSIPIVTLPFIIEQAGGGGGSPGGSTRRTVNVMAISSTHLDNELFEPVNFCFESHS